jgi:streptomycin 6-kinase
LERLGRPLSALGSSVEDQIDVMARTLPPTWRRLDAAAAGRFTNGADKARWLAAFIAEHAEQGVGEGRCRRSTIELAVELAHRRAAAYDPATAVFIHGDAHADNLLQAGRADDGPAFKLIDPEGLVSEPAHDLAIPLRSWHDADADRVHGWFTRMSDATGVDRRAIWEWAFVERVSTGLFLASLGEAEEAAEFLAVADALAADRRES